MELHDCPECGKKVEIGAIDSGLARIRRHRVVVDGPACQGSYQVVSTGDNYGHCWRHHDGSVRLDHMDCREGDYWGGPLVEGQQTVLV